MKIILLTQYYPPEIGAAQNRLSALAQSLLRRGHAVTVLTAFPNYPAGRVRSDYQGHAYTRTVEDGIEIIRTWITPRPGNAWLARGLTYLTFAISALVFGAMRLPRADVLIWETPPLTLGPTAYLLSRIKGAKLITNVSDLWPASLEAIGILNKGITLRMLYGLEEFLYHKSFLISGQTEFIIHDISARVRDVPTTLWRNGVDSAGFVTAYASTWRDRWKIAGGQFVVGYAGLLGMSQGLEVIIRSASILREAPVSFVLVGDGPAKQTLEFQVRELGLGNVVLAPSCRHDDMPGVWSAFDCAIVCLRDLPLFLGAVPSKTYEALAAGVPVVLAIKGEAAMVVGQADAGIVVEPENPDAIAAAIERLRSDPALRSTLGRNGKRVAETLYDRATLNRRFIDSLEKTLV